MNLLIGAINIQSKLANVGLLLLRVFTGLTLAVAHGGGKIPPPEPYITLVKSMGFPLPSFFAWLSGSAELFGGIFLAAGFLTRPAAFFIAITMGVAGLIAHAADPFGRKEKAFLYLFIVILYILLGGGRYAIDRIIRRKVK